MMLSFLEEIIELIKGKSGAEDISLLHNYITPSQINDFRIECFNEINKIPNILERLFNSAKNTIHDLMGNDILGQNKLNLSIQMPLDESSQLNMHTDTISGQSEYEIVLWSPLTKAFATNSIYILPKHRSFEVYSNLHEYELIGNTGLFEKFKDELNYIELEPPQFMLFSSTLLHGNTINKTSKTRISFNYRYKPTYSKKVFKVENERKLGTFYVPVSLSAITQLVLEYKEPGNFL